MRERFAGVLAHPTMFPSPYGVGDLGDGAKAFVDYLQRAGQKIWQVLPLGPTGFGDSPYQSFCSFAGQPLIISPDRLKDMGLLWEEDGRDIPNFSADMTDYGPVIEYKERLYHLAYGRFQENQNEELEKEYKTFVRRNEWVKDYSLFMALKEYHQGAQWQLWSKKLRTPDEDTKKEWENTLAEQVGYYRFIQFIFFKQWFEMKEYANERGIRLIGDIPIFVSSDSADVWANQELFKLKANGYPSAVAGVPPDYFSATGQLWGNPLYNWKKHKAIDYEWWIDRVRQQLTMTDYLRIDHFRGFEANWSVPFGEETAINGKWVKGPGEDLFYAIAKALGDNLPIIAEDLGIITPEVERLRDTFEFPGMKILQFAFDSTDENDFLPHYYNENCICYTGTHDNDTTKGWYQDIPDWCKNKVKAYAHSDGNHITWDFIKMAYASVAKFAIIPIQDVMDLGREARFNTPGTAENNWQWRFTREMLTDQRADELRELARLYGRL